MACPMLLGQPVILSKENPFRVLSFHGNAKNDKSDSSGSCAEDTEEIKTEASVVQSHPISFASEDSEGNILVKAQTSSVTVDGVSERSTNSGESESQEVKVSKADWKLLKSAMTWIRALDAGMHPPYCIFDFIQFYDFG